MMFFLHGDWKNVGGPGVDPNHMIHMVDGRNPAITSWYGKYPAMYKVLCIQGA